MGCRAWWQREATDVLGEEAAGAGEGLVLDAAGLRRLRAVVMRARVVSITLRGLRAATGARCRRGRPLTRSARWRR